MMKVIDNKTVEVYKLELEIEKTGHITNTYIIKDKITSEVCVVDPAFNEAIIREKIKKIQGNCKTVVITHSHADHIAALANFVNGTEIRAYIHNLDYAGLYDSNLNEENIVGTKVGPVESTKVINLKDKNTITIGETILEVIHTPGHTIGSICLWDEKNNLLYSGDTIFENSYGRTDLINGNHEEMGDSLKKIFSNLDNPKVFSGHGRDFYLRDSERKVLLLYSISM